MVVRQLAKDISCTTLVDNSTNVIKSMRLEAVGTLRFLRSVQDDERLEKAKTFALSTEVCKLMVAVIFLISKHTFDQHKNRNF